MTYENLLIHRADIGYFTLQFLIKRALTRSELYFDENLPASEEWDLLLRLTRLCRIDYVPEVLARIYNDSVIRISNPINELKSRLIILEKYNTDLKARPKALRSCYFELAVKYYRAREAMNYVRHYLRASIIAYPMHPSGYIGLAFAGLGKQSFGLFLRLYNVITGKLNQIMIILRISS
jgi:hypothetical protein